MPQLIEKIDLLNKLKNNLKNPHLIAILFKENQENILIFNTKDTLTLNLLNLHKSLVKSQTYLKKM